MPSPASPASSSRPLSISEVLKFNKNHDPGNGQFTSAGGSVFAGRSETWQSTARAAAADVLKGQDDDGFEHANVFDNQGNTVLRTYGNKTSINFLPSEFALLRPGMSMMHNHPNNSSVSRSDMLLAAAYNIKVLATNKDGGFYEGKMLGPVSTYDKVMNRVIDAVYKGIDDKKVVEAEASRVFQHVINLVAQKAGIISYRYDLDPPAQKAWDAGKEFYQGVIDGK